MLREVSICGKFNEVVEALVDSQPQSDGATLKRGQPPTANIKYQD